MDDDEEQQALPIQRQKRFQYQSYPATLKQVHLPSASVKTTFDDEISDDQSYFHAGIAEWRQLNLSAAFLKFAAKVDPLSASMPLLLHHCRDVVSLLIDCLANGDDESLNPLLDLLQKLVHDIRTSLLPMYAPILGALLKLAPRPLAAETLAALMASLASVFKHLLVLQPELLVNTWDSLSSAMLKCNAEVERMIAEVWANFLRRLRGSQRDQSVNLILKDLEKLPLFSAWIFVSSFKSISQTLHTTTPSILAQVLSYHLQTDTAEPTHTLIRRVLTASIHHCKPSTFAPIGDVLVAQLTTDVMEGSENQRRVMKILAVACSVRQGSRFTQSQISAILTQLHALPLPRDESVQSALLELVCTCLAAAELQVRLGVGRRMIQKIWEERLLGAQLTGMLAEMQWDEWKSILLPPLLSNTLALLEEYPKFTLSLLASLHRQNRLSDVAEAWRSQVSAWLSLRLQGWVQTEVNVIELTDVLSLNNLIHSLGPTLIQIVNRLIEIPSPEEDYKQNPTNAGWVIGSCLQALSHTGVTWQANFDVPSWVQKIVKRWGWSQSVLLGLTNIAQFCYEPLKIEDVYPHLSVSLTSHVQNIRLGVLRFLNSPLISRTNFESDAIQRCLNAEEISIDVQGARERVLKIGRVRALLQAGEGLEIDITVRWLLAQLKVNLKPVWLPASQALASLALQHGSQVWECLFHELQMISQGCISSTPQWFNNPRNDGEMTEVEKTWRCPHFEKMVRITARWMKEQQKLYDMIEAQMPTDRLDLSNYENQLLRTLTECPALAEKNNRTLIPFFLSFSSPSSIPKPPRQKVVTWLTLLSKFTNPKAIHSTTALQIFYTTQLSHPDRLVQSLALTCLLTYKSPSLTPYEQKLRLLLDDMKWRDELTSFNLFSDVDVAHREDLIPVIIRLFYGMMREKRVRGEGADKQTALLAALAHCKERELGVFVDLMLEHLRNGDASYQSNFEFVGLNRNVTEKQQVGFLTLLGEVLRNLGPLLLTYWPQLFSMTLELLNHSQKLIENASSKENGLTQSGEEEDGDLHDGTFMTSARRMRVIRQLGFKRFADFCRSSAAFDFTPYMPATFQSIISPRLTVFDQENIQAPSGLMNLFHVWALKPETAIFLVRYDNRVLPKIYQCLTAVNVKYAVISRTFDIVEHILSLSSVDDTVRHLIVHPHVSVLLDNLTILIERASAAGGIASDLPQREIEILSAIAPHVSNPAQATRLLALLVPILRYPAKSVSEKIKVDLLNVISKLMPLIHDVATSTSSMYDKVYQLLSTLFQTLRGRQSRLALVAVFEQFAILDPSLQPLAQILSSLNAFSVKRSEEPDFERRLDAFSSLNGEVYRTLATQQWIPVIHNMLHFMHDAEELAIRSSAAFTLKRFIDVLATEPTPELDAAFAKVLYPGLKRGLRSKVELVRAEILGVIGYAVGKCGTLAGLQDMRVLLANGDEEANFFNNIHHIQTHRRIRALKRLSNQCNQASIRSSTLQDIFLPLVGHFIVGAAATDHHLVNEAVLTMGHIAENLSWAAYYGAVRQYIKLSREKTTAERACVRTLVAILEHFHFKMDDCLPEVTNADPGDDLGNVDNIPAQPIPIPQNAARIADAVNTRLLPTLLEYLERKDETEDSLRIPLSIGIATVAQHLPENIRVPQVSKLLTVLSQVLRSRSQETRDQTRATLCKIAEILGPEYLPLLLRELKAALLRGPQLHVLAFTIHSLLVHLTAPGPAAAFHNMDDCVASVAHVSAEVIFGQSGREVQAEGFRTAMKEVRGSASRALDSFMIIAKYITPSKISEILTPIRAVMHETESLKVMGQVDDVLRRITSGLNANQLLLPSELLVLCHTLLSQNARFLRQVSPGRGDLNAKGDFIIQRKREQAQELNHYAQNSFRFVAFGLDLFCTAFRRGHFDLHDPILISRLEPLVVVIGNSLYSNNSQVLVLGLKAATYILKCPLESIEDSLPVFIQQILDVIKLAGNTESEVVQNALKSLAMIIRDCQTANVKEKDLSFLLELIIPDLEESNRQTSVFSLLRAIVGRKFIAPEIYDIMDKVGEIMVTSQSSHVQEHCRGVLLQFLLDYPQGKGRLRAQMAFLAKNLAYAFESGRKSVMELLSAIISKFTESILCEYADMLFVALVMVVANDDSSKCREMAAELLKGLLGRLQPQHRNEIISHLHSWSLQVAQSPVARMAMQVYSIVIDTFQKESYQYIQTVLGDFNLAMKHSAEHMEQLEAEPEAGSNQMHQDIEWQLPYHSLIVIAKILRLFPNLTVEHEKLPWAAITAHLLFPHAWVRSGASRLIGTLFTAIPVGLPSENLPSEFPGSRQGMIDTARSLCVQLKSHHLDEQLGLQVVKNLFHIGKCFCLFPVATKKQDNRKPVELEERVGEASENIDESRAEENPVAWLFTKLSYQARGAHIARRNRFTAAENWHHQPASIIRWFAAMSAFMEPATLETYLFHILSPVYRISEDDTIRDVHMDELKVLTHELQELLQTKVGTTKFSEIYNSVRRGVVNLRHERKTSRVMKASTNPGAAASRRIQRNALKKDSKKRKRQAYVEGKIQHLPFKKQRKD